MQAQPIVTVSVCIPAYNGARFIGEAIASVLKQSFTDFEMIVVDDCSTDETLAVLTSFHDQRMRVVRNSARQGLVGNWNRCVELAQGEYICIFHQDDVMLPENLAAKVEILRRHPSVGMVHSNVLQIGPANERLAEWWQHKPQPGEEGIEHGAAFFKRLVLGENVVCCPSVVARRDCYDKLGGFDQRLPYTADWEMWLRIALFYDVAYLVKPLMAYRRHDANETLHFKGAKEMQQAYKAKMIALEKHAQRIPDAKALQSKVIRDSEQQALSHAFEAYRKHRAADAQSYLALATEIHVERTQISVSREQIDWLSQIIDSLLAEDRRAITSATSHLIEPQGLGTSGGSGQPIRYQPVFRAIIDEMTGRDIAENFPLRVIIKALIHKLAAKPAFRWLYRFRHISHKILGA
jgi:hypothetical protein